MERGLTTVTGECSIDLLVFERLSHGLRTSVVVGLEMSASRI